MKKKKLFQKYVSYLKESNFLYHVNRSEMSCLLTDILSTSGVKKPYFFSYNVFFTLKALPTAVEVQSQQEGKYSPQRDTPGTPG